jgi:hypothetical protein
MTTFFLFKTIVKWTDQLSNQNNCVISVLKCCVLYKIRARNGDSTSYGIFAFPTVSW